MKETIKSMRLKKEVIDRIQELATKENRSFSNMVETVLIKYLKELGK